MTRELRREGVTRRGAGKRGPQEYGPGRMGMTRHGRMCVTERKEPPSCAES